MKVSSTKATSRKVCIKSGDGTLIARGLYCTGGRPEGCYPVAILKITENFKSLSDGLQNIQEARGLTVVEVDGVNFENILFIGEIGSFLL